MTFNRMIHQRPQPGAGDTNIPPVQLLAQKKLGCGTATDVADTNDKNVFEHVLLNPHRHSPMKTGAATWLPT